MGIKFRINSIKNIIMKRVAATQSRFFTYNMVAPNPPRLVR